MSFDIQRLQKGDLFQVINKMKAIPFARFRRTNKSAFEYVEANAHRLGVMTDFPVIALKGNDIYSGHSFNSIHYNTHNPSLMKIFTDEFFITRKCRPILLEVFGEVPYELLQKIHPRELRWKSNSPLTIPRSVRSLALFLKSDIIDWSQCDKVEKCSLRPDMPNPVDPLLSISKLLEFWNQGYLENMQRFQSELRERKPDAEKEDIDSFLRSAGKHLPGYLVQQLEFVDLGQEDIPENQLLTKVASTRTRREDGSTAFIAVYERQYSYRLLPNKFISNTFCQIYFKRDDTTVKLFPFEFITTSTFY